MLFRKVYRDLITRRVRSALTLLGVVVGVAGLVAIITTAQGFARAQRDAFESGSRADLSIFLNNAPESLIRVIERIPGVLAADLRLNQYARGRLTDGGPWQDIHYLGIRDFQSQVTDRLELVEGRWPLEGEALIEPAAASRYGLASGDTIFYRDYSNRARPLTLSGLARLPTALSADITGLPYLFVSDQVVKEILDTPGYNELVIRLEPTASRQEISGALIAALEQRQIPKGEPRFSDPANFVGKRELDTLFIVLYLFSGLGILLSGFLVANTLAALVAEAVREIGILKAVGATRWQVLGTFLLAAALYGLAGTAIGLIAGSSLGFALLRGLGRVASLSPPFRIEPLALMTGSVVGLGVTLLGGAIPAWQASGITAKAALESQGVSRNFGRSRLDRLARHLAALPPLFAMSLRNLLRRKGRTSVTLVVVALAVAALLSAQSTEYSLGRAIDDIFRTYRAQAFLQFGEPVTAREAGALRRVAGVTEAEGWLLRNCTAGLSSTRCWSMPAGSTLYNPNLVAGHWLDPRDPLGVVISYDLAVERGLMIGDRFPLRYRDSEREVAVRGIVVDNAIFLGSTIQSKVFVPIATFAPMTGNDSAADIFALSLLPQNQADQQRILDEIDRKLASLKPSSTLALREFETSKEQTRILAVALQGMVILVGLVGAMGLVNTLALNVLERRREIGVLRALGTDNSQMGLLFLTEGMALGLFGWLIGMGLGWAMGRLFVDAIATALFPIPYHFPLSFGFSSLIFALLLSLASSLAPAFAAANIPTVEAIRYE